MAREVLPGLDSGRTSGVQTTASPAGRPTNELNLRDQARGGLDELAVSGGGATVLEDHGVLQADTDVPAPGYRGAQYGPGGDAFAVVQARGGQVVPVQGRLDVGREGHRVLRGEVV